MSQPTDESMQRDRRMRLEQWPLDGMPAKITKLVEGESERGGILILSAYLEELLGELVRASCISSEKAESILEFRRPAGDFDSKSSLCIAFGLIHESEAAGLNAVRRIRNRAAHFDKKGHGFDVLFDADQTVDQVGNLAEAMNLDRPGRQAGAVQAIFVIACRLLATKIMIRILEVNRPTPPRTVKEIANEIRAAVKDTEAGERFRQIETLLNDGDLDAVAQYLKDMGARIRSHVEKAGHDE